MRYLLLLLTSLVIGCGVAYVYDPYYHDYHPWERSEVVVYQQWELETHRPHREFRDRDEREQRQFWTWRHDHGQHNWRHRR